MNRKQRRQGQRDGTVCEHGHPKKTDGTGTPMCPHGCGFPPVGGFASFEDVQDDRRNGTGNA